MKSVARKLLEKFNKIHENTNDIGLEEWEIPTAYEAMSLPWKNNSFTPSNPDEEELCEFLSGLGVADENSGSYHLNNEGVSLRNKILKEGNIS